MGIRVVSCGLALDICVCGGVFVILVVDTINTMFVLHSWRRWSRIREVDDGRVDVLWDDLELLQRIFSTVSWYVPLWNRGPTHLLNGIEW